MTFLKADCPVGCPCPTYDCQEATTSAPTTTVSPIEINHVLVLNTRDSNNKPVVIQSAGGVGGRADIAVTALIPIGMGSAPGILKASVVTFRIFSGLHGSFNWCFSFFICDRLKYDFDKYLVMIDPTILSSQISPSGNPNALNKKRVLAW